MPKDPLLVDAKDEMLPELCEEAGITLKLIFLMRDSFNTEMDRYVCWNESNSMLSTRLKMQQASLERKRDVVAP